MMFDGLLGLTHKDMPGPGTGGLRMGVRENLIFILILALVLFFFVLTFFLPDDVDARRRKPRPAATLPADSGSA
jgi:hypothetical protein